MTEVNYPVDIDVKEPQSAPGSRARSIRPCWRRKPPAATLARDRVFSIENLTAFYGNSARDPRCLVRDLPSGW